MSINADWFDLITEVNRRAQFEQCDVVYVIAVEWERIVEARMHHCLLQLKAFLRRLTCVERVGTHQHRRFVQGALF